MLDNLLESEPALGITINGTWPLRDKHRWCGSSLQGFLHEDSIRGFILALLASGRVGWWRRSAGTALGGSRVIMHALHVVSQVPMAWEAISGNAAVAAFICTEVGFVAVAVHSVGFTLMTEEAGRGREPGVLTCYNLAPVGLQMGVDKFASRDEVVSIGEGRKGN